MTDITATYSLEVRSTGEVPKTRCKLADKTYVALSVIKGRVLSFELIALPTSLELDGTLTIRSLLRRYESDEPVNQMHLWVKIESQRDLKSGGKIFQVDCRLKVIPFASLDSFLALF